MTIVKGIFFSCLAIYALILLVLYLVQERLLFFPTQLEKTYKYTFSNVFQEKDIEVEQGVALNTLLFQAANPKGVVLFFHGNGGALDGWGRGAHVFTRNHFDVLYVDYRGYGKSDGVIRSEAQLLRDGQVLYEYVKSMYGEDKIILSGTSMGTGIAAKLAADNPPQTLILHAPYYSLKSLIQEKVRFVPSFIIRYRLETHNVLKDKKYPIILFHGDRDQVIPVDHAKRLKEENPEIELHILKGVGHNDIETHPAYRRRMEQILNPEDKGVGE